MRPKAPIRKSPEDVIAPHIRGPLERDPAIVPFPVAEMFVQEKPRSSTEAMMVLASGMRTRPVMAKAMPFVCEHTRRFGPPTPNGAL